MDARRLCLSARLPAESYGEVAEPNRRTPFVQLLYFLVVTQFLTEATAKPNRFILFLELLLIC